MTETAPARRPATTARRRPDVGLNAQPELDFEEIADEGRAALIARGSAYVREYVRIEKRPTILLKNLATVLVALRSQHQTKDGSIDLRGQSSSYRHDAAMIYAGEGIPPDSAAGIQAAVRYHISQVLREVYDEETLMSYDLTRPSALEKTRSRMEERKAILAAAAAEASSDPTKELATASPLRVLSSVSVILDRVPEDAIRDSLTDEQRATLDARLAEAQEHIRHLRRVIKSAGR